MWRYLVSTLIFIVFILWIENYVGWNSLLDSWHALNPAALVAALILLFTGYVIRAVRLYDYHRDTMVGQFGLSLRLTLQHNALNNLLPMRSGEISFPLLMSRYFSLPMAKSVPALLWFRVLDLHFLLILVGMTLGKNWVTPLLYVPLLLLWSIVPIVLYWTGLKSQHRVTQLNKNKISEVMHKLLAGLPKNSIMFWRSWFWTVTNWLIKLTVFTWLLSSFLDISMFQSLLGAISGEMTSVLPIHGLAGTGTYEAGVIVGVLPFGVEMKTALQGATNLHLFVLCAALTAGAATLIIPPEKSLEKE